jgi:hypothetical protein
MHCPSCKHTFGFAAALRIINPFRITCPACGSCLTMGRLGVMYLVAGALIGGTVAGVAIYMETNGYWVARESLLWAVIVLPLCSLMAEWVCCKKATLEVAPSHGKSSGA